MLLDSVDFDEVDEFLEELAEKIDKWVVAHDGEVEVPLVDAFGAVYTDATELP